MYNGKESRKTHGGIAGTCFLLLEPRHLDDSGETAKRIVRCRGVREVHLTSGRYGFVVSANASDSNDVGSISSAVKKASRSRLVSVAVSHLVYRRSA
ncbi:MAG: hypothetical protein KGH57_00250 [Candidatus Micrarchaeota archaeon]|nr:hypothetical protein [Candidatus Micrarchaeota archaeon]